MAVGIDLQLYRHAKQVEILRDLADDAEALGSPINGVFVFELRRAGGIEPLREEPTQLLPRLLIGHFAQIVGRRWLAGKLGGEAAHGLVEGRFAFHPAQHMEDDGAFAGDQRLELGRKSVEPANTGKGQIVVSQSVDRKVLHALFQP